MLKLPSYKFCDLRCRAISRVDQQIAGMQPLFSQREYCVSTRPTCDRDTLPFSLVALHIPRAPRQLISWQHQSLTRSTRVHHTPIHYTHTRYSHKRSIHIHVLWSLPWSNISKQFEEIRHILYYWTAWKSLRLLITSKILVLMKHYNKYLNSSKAYEKMLVWKSIIRLTLTLVCSLFSHGKVDGYHRKVAYCEPIGVYAAVRSAAGACVLWCMGV